MPHPNGIAIDRNFHFRPEIIGMTAILAEKKTS
jgi:hypothetical protein